MFRALRIPIIAIAVALPGCATLVGGGSNQAISFTSTPADASFAVKSSSGIQMASGRTPQTIQLPRKNEYQIEFSVPGYRTQSLALTKGVNGWLFGNLIFGWIPGLIIDFVTGAANKLEPALVQVDLQRGIGSSGTEALFAVVRQLKSSGKMVSERHVELHPIP